jgi:PDZ domain-containing protein
MANAQLAARTLALARIGESVSVLPGLLVTSTIDGRPADDVLEPGDVLLSVDGTEIGPGEGRVLAETIGALRPGDSVEIEYERDGERATASIRTASNGADPPVAIIGVFVEPRYEFPFDIAFEGQIEQIGGPSAGLAMTLAVLDELTAGELSGGVDVAVTGTIDIEGNVGPVGRVDLKAKAAKRRGATLMLVPECPEPAEPDAYASPADHGLAVDFYEACEAEVRKAADTIDTVVEVATLDDALAALADAGGDPLPTPQSGATTTSRA